MLPGAGARGAYQVGVLKAVAQLLPKDAHNPFAIISGTSAGAINAAVLAGRAANFERAIGDMERVWANFSADQVFRTDNWTMLKTSLHWLSAAIFGGLGVAQPGVAARQRTAARAAEAGRTLRRHRARDSTRASRGARDHGVRVHLRALSDVLPGPPVAEAVGARSPDRPRREDLARSSDGERRRAVRVSGREDRRRVLRRRLDAAPRAALARDPSRRGSHARDRRARRASRSRAAGRGRSAARRRSRISAATCSTRCSWTASIPISSGSRG